MEWKTLKSFSMLYVSIIAFSLWYYNYIMYKFIFIIDMKNNYFTPNNTNMTYFVYIMINILLYNETHSMLLLFAYDEKIFDIYINIILLWTSYSLTKRIPIMKLTFLWLFIIILRLNGNTKEWKIDGPIQKEDAKHDFRGIY